MRRFYSFLWIISLTNILMAQTLPEFSNGNSEKWYYLQFCRGGNVVQDMGEGVNIMTKSAIKGSSSQLWKVTGTQDKCEIVSKNGRHIYYNSNSWSNSGRFAASAVKTGSLKLYSTTTTYAPAWEIQTSSTQGYSMNQWGGYTSGRELGEWNQNDINNPLLFVLPSDLNVIDTLPSKKSEYKYTSISGYIPSNMLTLWYTFPVTAMTVSDPWMDYALPIGNGQLGGMIYGGINQDIVQFNEKTLWTGSSTERGAYQTMGNLYIEDAGNIFSTSSSAKSAGNYYRQLDLSTSTASSSWTSPDGKTQFTREYVASYPDKCIAIHIKASTSGAINNHFYLYNPHGNMAKYTDGEGEGEGVFCGKLTTVSYNARIKVNAVGGTVSTDSTGIYVKGADEATVILSAGTDYDPATLGYIKNTSSLGDTIKMYVQKASEKGWDDLYSCHLSDYKNLFARVTLNLDGAENKYPTNKIIDAYSGSSVVGYTRFLEELYFQYGRYLMISSSRGVDLPNNLQGIWNNNNDPAWQCDMHANINVQMNYWPAENTNLSELHSKYLDYLYDMAMVQPQWQSYAKDRCGQSCGWANFTENNIFGHCTTWHNDYVEAGAWACSHLWQHYRYTLDKDFLKNKALPVMLSCVKFWMERLTLAKDGTYECPNEWSPEHGPDKTVTAHAQQIVWSLFSNTIDAIKELGMTDAGVTENFVSQLTAKFNKLDNGLHNEAYKGTFGARRYGVSSGDSILREWKYIDYATGNGTESDHRHLSHLMCLYPLNEVTPSSPYFNTAVNSLKLRGIQSQGWSMGWKMNLWARALQGDSCRQILKLALKHSQYYVVNMTPDAGGVYYNMLDAHSPFQIDGNLGVCSGIAEMLLQSGNDTISLLPALPSTWAKGSVRGLRAVNNFEVDETWEKYILKEAVIKSFSGKCCSLCYTGINKAIIKDNKGNNISYKIINNNHITFDTDINGIYTISMNGSSDKVVNTKRSGIIVNVNGDSVSITGQDISSITVFDLNGRKILCTNKSKFHINNHERKAFILSIRDLKGETNIRKIIL